MKLPRPIRTLPLSSRPDAMHKDLGIALIGTGGTIAGRASDATTASHYRPASLGVDAILASIPELATRYRIEVQQAFQLGSYDLTPEHWLSLLRTVEQALADPGIGAALITHGTDTLEETAAFLHLSVQSPKPVIVVGAMRPASAYSADGPANVIDGCTVALHPGAVGRGTMVVMNGRIHSALLVTKRHVSSTEAFDSGFEGALGEVADQSLRWFRPAHRVRPLKVPDPCELPRVDLVPAYAGSDEVAIEAFVRAGAKAIVHAGLGNGNAPTGSRAALQSLARRGVWLGRCSRWIPGGITRNSSMFDDDQLGNP
ncbi:MAG: asparaginase [Betaproteobacteria bacterium]|nr:asparaginase [Betaproteobacteria bacterium]